MGRSGYKIYDHHTADYIQIYKENWQQNYAGVHFEIYYKTLNNLIGFKRVPIQIELHIESSTPAEKVEKLEKNKIGQGTKKWRAVNLNNNQYIIENSEYYDFSDSEKINESIKKIMEKLESLEEQWADKIDDVFEE